MQSSGLSGPAESALTWSVTWSLTWSVGAGIDMTYWERRDLGDGPRFEQLRRNQPLASDLVSQMEAAELREAVEEAFAGLAMNRQT